MALDLHYPSRDAVQALRSNIVEVEVEIFGSNLIFVFFFGVYLKCLNETCSFGYMV